MNLRQANFRPIRVWSIATLVCGGIGSTLVARSIFSLFPVSSSDPVVAVVRKLTDVVVAPAQAVLGKPQQALGAQVDAPALATLALLFGLCLVVSSVRGFLAHAS